MPDGRTDDESRATVATRQKSTQQGARLLSIWRGWSSSAKEAAAIRFSAGQEMQKQLGDDVDRGLAELCACDARHGSSRQSSWG